jgi:hypothetical protein
MKEPRSRLTGSGGRRRGLIVTSLLAVVLVAAAGMAGAAGAATVSAPLPSPTWTHPVPMVTTSTGATVDVTQCFGCHLGKYTQWQQSSPYTDGPYGELKGHNVTLAEAYTNVGHNTEEPLVNDCQHCMSPFSTRSFGGELQPSPWASPVDIGSYVQPLDQTGPWSLTAPYAAANSGGAHAGYFLPADHVTYNPAPTDPLGGAFEGIGCRSCHDVANPTQVGAQLLPSLAWFNGDTFAYEPVSIADPNELCTKCHATDDSRSAAPGSVHAGLQCIDCHMKDYNGQNAGGHDHSFSAGLPKDAFAQTSCAQVGCHASGSHPQVTGLKTSFHDPGSYMANQPTDDAGALVPGLDGLLYSSTARHNIHAVTCDTCHHPSAVKTAYTVVYSPKPNLAVSGRRIDKATIPQTATTGQVSLWTRPRAGAPQEYAMVATAGSASSAAGTAFALKPAGAFKVNSLIFVTQGYLGATGDQFPGLGRGVAATVWVKAAIRLSSAAARVHHGGRVTLTTFVWPNKKSKTVKLYASRNGGAWRLVTSLRLGASSSVRYSWKAPSAKGTYRLQSRWGGDASNKANSSTAKSIKVY